VLREAAPNVCLACDGGFPILRHAVASSEPKNGVRVFFTCKINRSGYIFNKWFMVNLGESVLIKLSRTMLCICFAVFMSLGAEASFAGNFAEMRAAAEQGDASAQSKLGQMYLNGDGVPQDLAEAVKWIRLAAEQGSAVDQVALGFG
jgi:hypothetical protein